MSEMFPLRDPVGPDRAALPQPARELIAARVAPAADQTDRKGVTRAVIDEFAAVGLLGDALTPAAAMRELSEVLAGADATTWFCWVQHQTPLRILKGEGAGLREPAGGQLTEQLLPDLRSGRSLAAVAFAHVRRPGPPNPAATRVDGGWRLDGRLDWVTSWDIADVVMVMAQGVPPYDSLLVCAYLPAGRAQERLAGVTVGEPLSLLAMSGTHTRPITLADVHVPDARVGAILDRHAWLAQDASRTLDANPAAFGVTRGAIAELDAIAEQRADSSLAALAAELALTCRSVRGHAYAAADDGAPPETRVALRAASLQLAIDATTAVVTARAGASMLRGTSAERRLREAMFLQVQAQTATTRAASLALTAARLPTLRATGGR
ncbi:MAG: hypothetical protein GC156_00810 [Actinomycetales bacterium]|nr:hypothetical protein [Actinomycetales bacterium]